MRLEELVRDFLDEIKARMSENTHKNYKVHMKDFLDFCSEHSVQDLTTWNGKETRAYRSWLQERGYKAKTLNTKMSTLKSFFDFLVDENIVKGNPITRRAYVREEKTTPRFLTDAELKKLDIALEKIRPDVALLFRTQLATGTRLSEVLNLTSEDVMVIDNGVFVRVKGKGSKERIVPVLDEFIAKELLRLKRKEGRLFSFSRSTVFYYANELKKLTGVDFKSHRLRHTVATKLLNAGTPIDTVQLVLGHASISTTRRYAQTSPESVRRLAVKVK